jgi:2-succinyl-5-enolpyruvyl-6-hydroxy-3-cyclohexene-1-carboxylate synthase
MTAAVQTTWCELIAATLGESVQLCVISPGSRSTPLVAALARVASLQLVTIIDERAAAFYALGAARATGRPVALVCTSGTAAAHYLPAIIEASMAGVPLIAVTANRPPELHECGASQTIDQHALYGGFVRGAFDLGAPVASELALRAVRRKLVQAITLALGPAPGPVHIDAPFRKPLEPAVPSTDEECALARVVAELVRRPAIIAPPVLSPDATAIATLARTVAAEPRGVIVAGALPVGFAREEVFELAARTGYPIIAETGSQLRLGPVPANVTLVAHFDLTALDRLPRPAVIIQLGAEPVAAGWPAFLARERSARWVFAGSWWHDPDSSSDCVLLGDPATAVALVCIELRRLGEHSLDRIRTRRQVERTAASEAWCAEWRHVESRAVIGRDEALAAHPHSEACVIRAAIDAAPGGTILQIGNSLPIRVVDHVSSGGAAHPVITQRGAAGIDGLIASAAGATRAGHPVLLVLGDVSFAHDLGGLLAARAAMAPLAILVIDNGGGQIFSGLPIARAELGETFGRHWLTAPELDPTAIATALGARAITATTSAAVATAIASALDLGVTVIHAPVTASGAHDVRRAALQFHDTPPLLAQLGGEP